MSKTIINNIGDTIVEVLIVIAILGFVLGGAFAVVRRSSQQIRDAQERGEALSLAKSQLELLRNNGPKAYQTAQPKTFCYDASSGTLQTNTLNFNTLPALAADQFTGYSNCTQAPQNGTQYHIAIDYSNSTNIYDVHVRWVSATGGQNNEVVLNYRMY